MTRKIKPERYDDRPVAAFEIAPHRYRYDAIDERPEATSVREFKERVPYKAGDVVYVAEGGAPVKALITYVGVYYDRHSDRREWFQVLFETKAGRWARIWRRTYPGPIQRGYKLAGLAPDVPD